LETTPRETTREGFAGWCERPDALLTLPRDAADHAIVGDWGRTTLDRFGRLDAAMANAGYATRGGRPGQAAIPNTCQAWLGDVSRLQLRVGFVWGCRSSRTRFSRPESE
jgi:hypothetical protein